MNPKLSHCIEKGLVLLLAAMFTLPVILGWVLLIPQVNVRAPRWLRNDSLSGETYTPQAVTPSWANVSSARYQEALAKNYGVRFAGREAIIRVVNELFMRGLHTSSKEVLVGPDNVLIERRYGEEYCFRRGPDAYLRVLVNALRRMQDYCDSRGMPFVFVITPSKAAIYPEGLPMSWQKRRRPETRFYDLLLPLLQETHIRYVDGHRILADLKPSAPLPLFPPGGTHWTDPAALAVANPLLELLASRGLNVQPIHDYTTQVSNDPEDQDADMAVLSNVVSAIHYPVATILPRSMRVPGRRRPNIVFVGGSFTMSIIRLLDASQQFAELEDYLYYTQSKWTGAWGEMHQLARPTPPLNFPADVFAADAMVMEINEEFLNSGEVSIQAFLDDALAVLPARGAAKVPFQNEASIGYRWGDTLSLVASDQPFKAAALSGFTERKSLGIMSLGPVATLHLRTPPATKNVVLEVEAGAFLVDTRLPEQHVSVLANDHPIGEWVWNKDTPAHQELTIPQEDFNGNELTLEFRVARPSSPVEFGLSTDGNKYGIILSSLRLHEQPEFDYRWGDTLSLSANDQPLNDAALTNFTPRTAFGAYTLGQEATLHLHTPPADANMVLEVDAGAFLVDTRLPEQRVNVLANGHPVGEWTWRADTEAHHELTIPREDFRGDELTLEFRVARPGSPAEFGLSADKSEYGIIISKLRLHAEPQTEYRWGDTLSLVADDQPFDAAGISGFTVRTKLGAYTLGSVARLHLHTPPADANMVLEVEAGAFLVDTRLPEQRVSVLANGHPVGEWTWRVDTEAHHELTIPRELLGGGELQLEFHVARPGSPSEFGLGADKSEYGIIISKLRLHAEPQIDYHWGDTLSLMANNQPFNDATLTGFTVRTPLGVHTLGPVATMHLCTPPAERNMVLEVDAKPFLVDTRLLEQRVSVLANGQPVGEWTWRAELPDHHELSIPRDVIRGGELVLEFRVARPASPLEFGLSADKNEYGIVISNLRLHAEPQTEYRWGDTLSLMTDNSPFDATGLSGFTVRTKLGAYTLGSVAAMHLRTPPAESDMVLEVEAGAFLVDTRLPEQDVSVFVNGHRVGEWLWRSDTPAYHEMSIPQEYFRGNELELEFRIARPGSPAEFGLSADTNKYGIIIAKVRLIKGRVEQE